MIIHQNTTNLKIIYQVSWSQSLRFVFYDHFTKICKNAILYWKMWIFDTLLYILRHKTKSKHDQNSYERILEMGMVLLCIGIPDYSVFWKFFGENYRIFSFLAIFNQISPNVFIFCPKNRNMGKVSHPLCSWIIQLSRMGSFVLWSCLVLDLWRKT